MPAENSIFISSSIAVALLHTLSGPDHYLPFIALSRSKNWSFAYTLFWTLICGIGHVGSSVILGLAGAGLGWNMEKMLHIENIRGGISGWAFIVLGLVYMIWGLHQANKNISHKHFESDVEGNMFVFEHNHVSISKPIQKHKVTPWVIFIIFLLGPCEPMIPLLFAPAAQHSITGMITLIVSYTFFTLLSMMVMVTLGLKGIAFSKINQMEKHMHAIAGFTILICGAGMVLLNW
jgi:sulfite exporter TauE/SafE